jgi:hypothetical protein
VTPPRPTLNPLEVFFVMGAVALVLELFFLWRAFGTPAADPVAPLRIGFDLLFLALYLARSRWAWHALLVLGLVGTPLVTLLAHLDSLLAPESVERTSVGLVVAAVLAAWVARQRPAYYTHLGLEAGGSEP